MGIPLIIHNIQAHKYYGPNYHPKNNIEKQRLDESKFYRCQLEFNFLDYITRKNSVEKLNMEQVENLQLLLEEQALHNNSYINYQGDRPGSTGLFDKYGDIDKQKKKEYIKKLQNTTSNIWTSIISFTPEYSDKYVSNKKQAFDTIKSTIDVFFKKCGLDPSNMEWTAAYHTNTDNRHIHLQFWEKEKNKIDSKGNECYSHWKLPKDALESWKADIAYFHKAEPLKYLPLRDNIKENVMSLIKNDNTKILANLDIKLKNIQSYQYARLTKNNQLEINNTIDKIINSNPGIKKVYDEYFNNLLRTQKEILCNCKEVNVKPTPEQKGFASSRIAEFYNRCGNSILNVLKEYRELNESTKKKKLEHRKDALLKLPKEKSANSRRIIYKNTLETRTRNSKFRSLLQRLVVIIASDVSRENNSLDSWWRKDADYEEIRKD